MYQSKCHILMAFLLCVFFHGFVNCTFEQMWLNNCHIYRVSPWCVFSRGIWISNIQQMLQMNCFSVVGYNFSVTAAIQMPHMKCWSPAKVHVCTFRLDFSWDYIHKNLTLLWNCSHFHKPSFYLLCQYVLKLLDKFHLVTVLGEELHQISHREHMKTDKMMIYHLCLFSVSFETHSVPIWVYNIELAHVSKFWLQFQLLLNSFFFLNSNIDETDSNSVNGVGMSHQLIVLSLLFYDI